MNIINSFRQKGRRITIISDKEILKKAVIDNLVTEDKRKLIAEASGIHENVQDHQISFTTILPEFSEKYEDLSKRIEQLERAVKQIIELLSCDHVMASLSAS